MIVRISNEGQYRLDDALHGQLNELDDAVVAAVDGDDEDGYHEAFEELLRFVRDEGDAAGRGRPRGVGVRSCPRQT